MKHAPVSETALHEAGHAVVGRVLGIEVQQVTLVPQGRSLGAVLFRRGTKRRNPVGAAVYTEMRWREAKNPGSTATLDFVWPSNRALHAHILMLLAGAAAVKQARGTVPTGCGSDNYHVAAMVKCLDCADPVSRRRRLRKMARMLVRRHADAIRRLAIELDVVGTIERTELDKFLWNGTQTKHAGNYYNDVNM